MRTPVPLTMATSKLGELPAIGAVASVTVVVTVVDWFEDACTNAIPAAKSGVVRCETAPEGASSTMDCTAPADVPAMVVV